MVSELFRTYVAGILSPTVFLGTFLLFGVLHLLRKNNQTSRLLLVWAVACYFVFTLAPLKRTLFTLTEESPSLPVGEYQYVVVLGARVFPDDKVPLSSQLGAAIMARLVHGITLLNRHPRAKLILTGNGASGVAEAELLKAQAMELGVVSERIITDNLSLNTKDHGKYLAPILKSKKFIIVTSANHMPRALKNFESYGLRGTPAPTDFANKTSFSVEDFIPRGENLAALDRWLTETYSKLWTELRPLLQQGKAP